MSLILEALKKLEREKQAPDRGFLVMAHVPWATAAGRGARWPWIGGSLLVLLVAALAVAFFGKGRATERPLPKTAPELPAATVPTTSSPTLVAAPQLAPPPPSSRLADPPRPDLRSGRADATPPPRAAVPGSDPLGEPAPDEARTPEQAATAARAEALPREKAAPNGLDLRLNAISRQDGHPVAILNDRLVREGDIFDGILVVRIGEAEVEVEVDGKRRIVTF